MTLHFATYHRFTKDSTVSIEGGGNGEGGGELIGEGEVSEESLLLPSPTSNSTRGSVGTERSMGGLAMVGFCWSMGDELCFCCNNSAAFSPEPAPLFFLPTTCFGFKNLAGAAHFFDLTPVLSFSLILCIHIFSLASWFFRWMLSPFFPLVRTQIFSCLKTRSTTNFRPQ